MAAVANKRSVMTLYSHTTDIFSHRVRLVLAEKGVTVDILPVDPANKPEELGKLNPYQSLPTLVDRSLVLYEPRIMMEYLDERFPHPPLMPVYPMARAKSRMMMYRIDKEWTPLLAKIETGTEAIAEKARKVLLNNIISTIPIFTEMPYFLSEEYSLVDCTVAPLLWRLPAVGIELPKKSAKVLHQYMDRLFERDAFMASLTEPERELREPLMEIA